MTDLKKSTFQPSVFLSSTGFGRRIIHLKAKEAFFTQGGPADAIFFLQKGRARLNVVSASGKEATITLLSSGDFMGEESLTSDSGIRLSTATAMTACTALRIERAQMIAVMHQERAFSDLFIRFLLGRIVRTQADLIDQLFNSSEKRLARILVLMAEFGKEGEPERIIPKITQETLADMIGTTRSRVSFFMNRFRKLGLIDYNGRILVHKSLQDVVLQDKLSLEQSTRAALLGSSQRKIILPVQHSHLSLPPARSADQKRSEREAFRHSGRTIHFAP